jgi:hypothetical protein
MIPFQFHRRIPFVRRPFWQRDVAVAERDAALAQLAQVRAERDTALKRLEETTGILQALQQEKNSLQNVVASNRDPSLALADGDEGVLRQFISRGLWYLVERIDALTLAGRKLACPICDRHERRENLEIRLSECIFGGGRLERYVCPGCGCVYGPSRYLELPADLVAADYALLYTDYNESDSTVSELRTLRSLNPSFGRLYLNWGCGRWSRAVEVARSEGYDVWGYEPTTSKRERSFVVARKEAITTGFAGIFSNNVIEHMLRPVDEFRYFHRILGLGGLMAHASPCYQYCYEYSRFHVVFLLGDAPYVLAERSGFRVVHREVDGEFRNCIFERI